MPEEGDSRWDRYIKAARTIGKGGRVESLIKGDSIRPAALSNEVPRSDDTKRKRPVGKGH